MDTIQHNGATYVKANTLAKRHRYTTDYLGQLCRAGKVDAQLVGRAWYVNEKSLLTHKIDRNKDTRSNEILSKITPEIVPADPEMVKVAIHSTLSKKTHRQFFSDELRPTLEHHWQDRAVLYGDDSSTLVPQVTNKIVTTLVQSLPSDEKTVAIPIDLVEPEKVVVKDASHYNHREHLTFTDLPEVTLEGTVEISDLDSAADYAEPEPVTRIDFPKTEVLREPVVAKITRYEKPVRPVARPQEGTAVPIHTVVPQVPVVAVVAASTVPEPTPAPLKMVALPPRPKAARTTMLLLPLVIIFSVLVTGLSLAFSSVTLYEGGAVHSSFSFHTSNLGEALLYLANRP